MEKQIVITVFMTRKVYQIAKIRSRGAALRNSAYRFKNTATNLVLMVVDHIYHPNPGKKCLGHLWSVKSHPQLVKVGPSKSNHTCFLDNGQVERLAA